MLRMIHWLKLLLILLVGVSSLLATSPPPPNVIRIVTANNPANGEPFYFSESQDGFACKDEKVKLVWSLFNPESVVVTAAPTNAFNPPLENKTLQDGGEIPLIFLAPAKLIIKYSEPLEYQISELSEDICSGFPVAPVVGGYIGTLTQTAPQAAILESHLQLIWIEDKLHARVDVRSPFPCAFDASIDSITCIEGEATAPTFKLEGKFIENRYEGSYQGVGETVGGQTSFAGTFVFSKPTP